MIRNLLALSLCLCVQSLCRADVIVQFGQGGVVAPLDGGVQRFSATQGGQLTLDIFMVQQGVDPANGILADYRLSPGATTRGLGSYYLEMAVRNAGSALAQSGIRADLSSFTFQNGFDGRSGESTYLDAPNGNVQAGPSSTLRLVGIAPDDPGDGGALVLQRTAAAPFQIAVGPNTNSVADNSIRLGTITFNIASDATLGDYQLGVSAPGSIQRSNLGNDITNGYFDINNLGAGIATINVVGVPEPTTMALFSICAGGLGFARFRRKKAAAKK